MKLNSISGNATQLIGLYGAVGQYVYDLETGELVGTGNNVTFELGKWYRIVTYKTDNSSLGTNYTFAYVGNAATEGNASASFRNFEAYDHYWTTDGGQDAATVSYGLENGENIYVYSTLSHPISASEWSRRAILNVTNTASDIVSVKVKILSVVDSNGNPYVNTSKAVIDVVDISGEVFYDEAGHVVSANALENDEWYTIFWKGTGAAQYELYMFTGSPMVHAEALFKNVAVTAAENVNVILDLNYEGAGIPETVQVTQGSAYGTLTEPTREGYTFGGWYTDAACTGEAVTEDTIVMASHTLYAKWTKYVPEDSNSVTVDSAANGTVTHDFVSDKHIYTYTTRGTAGTAGQWARRVNISFPEGQTFVAVEFRFTEAMTADGTPFDPSLGVLYDGQGNGGDYINSLAIYDANGNQIANSNAATGLTVGEWYILVAGLKNTTKLELYPAHNHTADVPTVTMEIRERICTPITDADIGNGVLVTPPETDY